MKILMVSPMPPARQATNAVPLVTHAQLAALAPKFEVTVVTVAGPDPSELEALDELEREGYAVKAARRATPYGRGLWQRRRQLAGMWLRGKYPFRTVWYYDPEIQRILDSLLSQEAFDLISVQDNAMGVYQYSERIPKVLTEVEVRRPRTVDLGGLQLKDRRGTIFSEIDWHRWRSYQRSAWRGFQRIQVFTSRDAEAARQLAPAVAPKLRINPFGIELPSLGEPVAVACDTLVFTGGMSHPPNVDAAIWLGREIMPILRRLRPGVKLEIVGSYPPPSVLALASEDIRVYSNVPAIEPFIERGAIVLAPVRTGGGQRMKVLQGMAMCKAVVTTSRGAEGLSMGGVQPPLVIANDAEGIAQAAAGLLASHERRLDLGHRARAYVEEHYSLPAYARRLEAIYTEIVDVATVAKATG